VQRQPALCVFCGRALPRLAENAVNNVSGHSKSSCEAAAELQLATRFVRRRDVVAARIAAQVLQLPRHLFDVFLRTGCLHNRLRRIVSLRDGHATIMAETD
jgi:hypothetical protein